MITEDKELLLKDLCSRLPYGVICEGVQVCSYGEHEAFGKLDSVNRDSSVYIDDYYCDINTVKPYLRPMSSMTKEEAIEMYFTVDVNVDDSRNVINCDVSRDKISFLLEHNGNYVGHRVLFFNDIYSLAQMDWLNKHHFDYRGLIPMGLALEAPEGMYKIE